MAGYLEQNYGDRILVVGKLKIKLLSNNHQILTLSFPKIKSVKSSENYFLSVINSIRQSLLSQLVLITAMAIQRSQF